MKIIDLKIGNLDRVSIPTRIVVKIFIGTETLSRLSVFRSMVNTLY